MSESEDILKELVYRGIESDVLDYKSAMNFNTIPRSAKAKFARHCLALANTRGGHIVVGVSEDQSGHPSVYTGLTEEESRSFDPSVVGPFVNRYADPAIDFTIDRPIIDGKRYAIFTIRPFDTLPHVCSGGIEDSLQLGIFYIRTVDASSRPAYRASEIHGLIQRALRNQRESLARMLRGILYERDENTLDDSAKFHEEELHSRNFFVQRKGDRHGNDVLLGIQIRPEEYILSKHSLSEIRRGTDSALENLEYSAPDFDSTPLRKEAYFTNTSLRTMPEKTRLMWQIYQSGQIVFYSYPPLTGKAICFDSIPLQIHNLLFFAGQYYVALKQEKVQLHLDLFLENTEGKHLMSTDSHIQKILYNNSNTRECRIDSIHLHLFEPVCTIVEKYRSLAAQLTREIAERFNIRDAQIIENEVLSHWE